MMVAVRQMAKQKTVGHLSERVATCLQFSTRPNMISIRFQRLHFRLAHLTGLPRDLRPEMQAIIPPEDETA